MVEQQIRVGLVVGDVELFRCRSPYWPTELRESIVAWTRSDPCPPDFDDDILRGVREHPSPARMITDGQVEAVILCDFPAGRAPTAQAFLSSGVHTFCYGPLAANLADALDMAGLAAKQPSTLAFIAAAEIRWPFDGAARRFLRSGCLGQITAIDVIQTSANLLHEQPTGHNFSGDNVLQVWSYAELLNMWIAPYASIYAVGSAPLRRATIEVDAAENLAQSVMISGRLVNGALGVEYHSGISTLKAEHNLLTVYGLSGTFRYRVAERRAFFAPPCGDFSDITDQLITDGGEQSYLPELDFLRVAKEPTRHPSTAALVSFSASAATMRKVHAIARSCSLDRTETVAESHFNRM